MIVLLVVAALPLRSYASVTADLCAVHGGMQASPELEHDHGSADDLSGRAGEHHATTSTCSHCASCSVGATLAADLTRRVVLIPNGADLIPFFDARKLGHVPDHPDRPPLVL